MCVCVCVSVYNVMCNVCVYVSMYNVMCNVCVCVLRYMWVAVSTRECLGFMNGRRSFLSLSSSLAPPCLCRSSLHSCCRCPSMETDGLIKTQCLPSLRVQQALYSGSQWSREQGQREVGGGRGEVK